MRKPDRRLLLIAAAAAVVFVLAVAAIGAGPALGYVLPVLLIATPLLSGRFVGEEIIHRAAARRRATTRTVRAPRSAAATRTAPFRAIRGGLLIAASLAVRPPPAVTTA